MPEKNVSGLNCPACGGTLEISEGRNTVACGYCESVHIISGDSGIPRFYIREEVSKDKLKQAAYKWFGTKDKAADLQGNYKVEEIFPVYVPFYRVTCHALGWILGRTGIGKPTDDGDFNTVEKRIDRFFDWNTPACNFSELGIDWIEPEGSTLYPFVNEEVQKRGIVFNPTLPPDEPLKNAQYYFEDAARAESGIAQATFKKLHLLKLKMTIVYYPLWIFRYKYKNRIYQIVFDACNGNMLSGSAPGDNKLRVWTHLALNFFGMLFLTTSIKSGDSAVAFWGFIIAIGLMYMGYLRFRFGKEVHYKLTKDGPVTNILQKIKQKFTIDNLIEITKKG
ncbi:MAG: hypothetical protein LWY06_16700 [Firmicutes bacterium]|nr:hypothetical protein [Bacillota bacterium]